MRNKRKYGDLGERYAIRLLLKNGYKIIEKNFNTRFGEIDIVAIDPSTGSGQSDYTLVFVEVKTRWSKKYCKPEEAVTPRKLGHIKKAAEFYLLTHPDHPKKLRIDVVAIEVEDQKVTSAKIIKVS